MAEFNKQFEKSLKAILGLFGVCLIAFSAGTYLYSLKTGICAGLFVIGIGMILDAIKK